MFVTTIPSNIWRLLLKPNYIRLNMRSAQLSAVLQKKLCYAVAERPDLQAIKY